jgi:FKBP-type peptidyl-prolyl cis-trans isomerase FklB
MKTRLIFFAAVSLLSFTLSIKADAQKSKLKSTEDSLSYALGVANYQYYLDDSIKINTSAFMKGMNDAAKRKPVMDATASSGFIIDYMQARENEKLEKQYKSQIETSKNFLAENAAKEGVIVTPSGLQYKIITTGSGNKPGPESMVKVNYTGTTIDGNKFDSSYDRKEPSQFRVNGVIKGWQEGLQLMPAGSKFILYVPYKLAYGERGVGSIIKPFETLIFEVELIEIVNE